MITRHTSVGLHRRVTVTCADDLRGDALIAWEEPARAAPAPAISAPELARPGIVREARVPVSALTKSWDNCWPAFLPPELPPAVAAAVIAELAVERVRINLTRALSDGSMLL